MRDGVLETLNLATGERTGRAGQDRITTLGSGVDGAVRRLATRYEVRGMRVKLSSYDHATVGSGSLVNEVQFAYNDFGQLIADYQSHSGAVNTGSTPQVQYGYESGSANTIRPTSLTYPNGRVLSYDYGTTGGIPDALSRIDAIKDGGTALAQYSYLGLGTFVITDYTEPDIKWILNDLSGTNDPDTGDIYSGFDRFGRVKDNRWYNYGGSADTDRIKYGYDRAGNRIWRQNTVATSLGKAFDEFYWYDGIHRLKDMQRGTLNAGKTAITGGTSTFAECWGLDTTGNWSNYRQDDNGDSSWDLIQNRANNTVNEITNITESAGPSWITPAYDAVGNMTAIPKPANPTVGYTGIYDAWNRLTAIKEGGDFVVEYAYDAAKRRTIQKSYSSGILSETRRLYYTEPSKWQVVEERVGSSSDAERQFVWGLRYRYVDDLVLRDRDTDGNGSLDERLYAMQDANWNVTGIANASGTIQERYAYSAYGITIFLDSSFTSGGTSSSQWETLFGGYLWDKSIGLYQGRNRILSAIQGLWVQQDPARYRDSMNLYEYVTSNPICNTDPFGLGLCGIPDKINPASLEELIAYLLTISGEAAAKIKKCLRKENTKLWERWVTAEKFAKIRNRAKRGGFICGKLLKYLFLAECEAACAGWYKSCMTDASDANQRCLDAARNAEDISLCSEIFTLDVTECATWYGICGVGCLLPIDPPSPGK
jgi:RHS repeat-associated protein